MVESFSACVGLEVRSGGWRCMDWMRYLTNALCHGDGDRERNDINAVMRLNLILNVRGQPYRHFWVH